VVLTMRPRSAAISGSITSERSQPGQGAFLVAFSHARVTDNIGCEDCCQTGFDPRRMPATHRGTSLFKCDPAAVFALTTGASIPGSRPVRPCEASAAPWKGAPTLDLYSTATRRCTACLKSTSTPAPSLRR
jgi:hypothetical protein